MKRYAFDEGLKEEFEKKYMRARAGTNIITIGSGIYSTISIINILSDNLRFSFYSSATNNAPTMIILLILLIPIFAWCISTYVMTLMTRTRNMLQDELIISDDGISGKYHKYDAYKAVDMCFSVAYEDILRVELEIIEKKYTRFAGGYFLMIYSKNKVYRLNIPTPYDAKTDIEFNMQNSIHL